MDDRETPLIGVDLYAPDFSKIAEGFGCLSCRIDGYEELRDQLRFAVEVGRPTVIEIDENTVTDW